MSARQQISFSQLPVEVTVSMIFLQLSERGMTRWFPPAALLRVIVTVPPLVVFDRGGMIKRRRVISPSDIRSRVITGIRQSREPIVDPDPYGYIV